MKSTEQARELKKLTDNIAKNLKTIQSFGYELSDLNQLAEASGRVAANLESLSRRSVHGVEEIGTKAAAALVELERLDESDWTVDAIDELGRKAAETAATLQQLEQAS